MKFRLNLPYCFSIFFIVGALTATAQGPRQEILLKDNWRFITDPSGVGERENWAGGLPSNAVRIQVPHTWNVMKEYQNYAGLAWYEKVFTLPASWKNKQVRIKFAAVYHDAVIYLNGKKLLEHRNSGYTSFYADLTNYLRKNASNKLVVSVSNAYSETNLPFKRSFDWVNDGGIIRSVTLIGTEKPSVRYIHITPDIRFSDTTAAAAVEFKLWEDDISQVQAVVSIIEKKSKKTIFTREQDILKQDGRFSTEINPGKIHLWHFNDPFLYEVSLTIKNNGIATDHVVSQFGFREIKLVGNRLYLNREPVRLPGMEYMPSSHPEYGSAEPRWIMDSVTTLFKDLNVTISRFHWQVDEYMLNLMDEKGILLQAEIPWWQQPGKLTPALEATARQQFDEMIERDYNHPCIFSWGISNEVYGNDRDSAQYASLRNYVKGMDSNRLVVVVSNETFKRGLKDESFIGDLPTWNEYVGTWFGKSKDELPQYFDKIESFIGERPLLITENGLCEPRFSGGDLRRINEMNYHYEEWAKKAYIAGCIYFCLNDYRTHMGEDGAGKFKARIHGITDLYLKKKPSYYVFKQLASPIEIKNVKKLNDTTIQVELFNKNTLPSYTISGYRIRWQNNDHKFLEKQLPGMKPGDKITLELNSMNQRYSFDVISPGGYNVISYPFVN